MLGSLKPFARIGSPSTLLKRSCVSHSSKTFTTIRVKGISYFSDSFYSKIHNLVFITFKKQISNSARDAKRRFKLPHILHKGMKSLTSQVNYTFIVIASVGTSQLNK